jgi:hypothetical protein
LCPIICYQLSGSLFLAKVPDGPRLNFECSLGPLKRNPDMHSLFLSKVPVNEPLQVPQQGPMERAARLEGIFFISLKFLTKIPLNKEIYPFSQRP